MIETSCLVLARDFREPWFADRAIELSEPLNLHRKLWEFCVTTQVFKERIKTGKALGFGVGRESIAAWLASQGVEVIATDHPEQHSAWSETAQHASSLDDLRREEICAFDQFYQHVIFRPVDMNQIPTDLLAGQFDFTWSCGSFEHIGSIAAGLNFFCQQMKCLRPGGIAVHTTEFNPSKGRTLQTSDIVLFQEQHLQELHYRLRVQGDKLFPLELEPELEDIDRIIDTPPWGLPHLSMQIGEFTTTSIALIAERGNL